MNVIIPTAMTDAILKGSSVLENEYGEWATGGWSALSAGVPNWSGMAVNAAGGVYCASLASESDIYYAADGVTFGRMSAAAVAWQVMGVDTYNNNIYAAVYGTDVYMQTNGTGAFVDLNVTHRNWGGFTGDGLGNIYACTRGAGAGRIYLWNGSDFVEDHASNKDFRGMCLDPVSGLMYLCVWAGDIYTYDGTTLTALGGTSRNWTGITADASGNIWAGASGVDVFKRTLGAGAFAASTLGAKAFSGLVYNDSKGYLYCSVQANDIYRANGTTSYSDGDKVQIIATHETYESLKNANQGKAPATETTWWLSLGKTNRWKCFDEQISVQTTQAESMTYVLAPGEVEAIAFMNLVSSTVDIIEIDNDDNLIVNGLDWTGATGTTQPTSWDKVGTPADYKIHTSAIQGLCCRITTDAANEGMSQTIAVSAATEYQLLFVYANSTGDLARVGVYDATHSADILTTTDLPDTANSWSVYSYVFTTPAGCTSVKISLLGKSSGDIVYFDYVKCAPTKYSETITTGALISYACKTDLWKDANCILTVKINNTGATAEIGEMVMGPKYDIGGRNPNYGISWGGQDWSTIEQGTFGYEIVERDKSKWMRLTVDVPEASWDYVSNLIQGYMSSYLMWLGSETNQCLMIYGFPDEWSFTANEPSYAVLDLSIKGIP